jgi:hypothetical protein
MEEGRLVEVIGGYSDYLAAPEKNGTRINAE